MILPVVRLYMWEYCTDPNINLWGLVNKTLEDVVMVDSTRAVNDTEPPPPSRHKHT
jgi:hypothetical protein